ncbi:MAG: flagellar motor protein MotB [Rhodospirillales bacterium]|jgi:chemotaxis protein MotB|nr:flagellar motor protein MotB [Rhodospirillales bacterium]
MADQGTTIIKKVKKGGHAGAHGGAWKVAYADFVTAMMAFFLLLWLLNSVSQEQLEGVSNYFAPQSTSATTSGSGGVLGGLSIAESGALGNPINRPPSVTMDLAPPSAGSGDTSESEEEDSESSAPESDVDEETAEEVLEKIEEEQFKEAEEAINQAIQSIPALQQMAESLVIDNTPEGLRIQIVDQEGLAMFPRGTANMFEHTEKMLSLVAKVVNTMPQKISIAGHTDATKFVGGARGYTNWELSADRANSSRRALLQMGIPEDRISRVVGKAAEDPFMKDDPNHARNRRISIILLRGTGETEGSGESGETGETGDTGEAGESGTPLPPPPAGLEAG